GLGWPIGHISLKDEPGDDEQVKAQKAWLRKHMTTEDCFFFEGPDGRLCYARVTLIRDVPAVVAELHKMVSSAIKEWADGVLAGKEKRDAWMDEETMKLLSRAAATEGYEWVKVEPGRLSVSIPMTAEVFRRLEREKLDEVKKNLGDL